MERPSPPQNKPWARLRQALRELVYEIVAVAAVAVAGWSVASTPVQNSLSAGTRIDFDLFGQPAGFNQ